MDTHHKQIVDGAVVAAVVDLLMDRTQGPSEAFATLCVALIKVNELNQVITGNSFTEDILISEIATTIRSMRQRSEAQH